MQQTIIAHRTITAEDKIVKDRKEVVIEIFQPYSIDHGQNYFCEIFFKGLESEPQQVGGIDSLQALSLAIETLKIKFEELKEIYNFYWTEDQVLMESIDYFPKYLFEK